VINSASTPTLDTAVLHNAERGVNLYETPNLNKRMKNAKWI